MAMAQVVHERSPSTPLGGGAGRHVINVGRIAPSLIHAGMGMGGHTRHSGVWDRQTGTCNTGHPTGRHVSEPEAVAPGR
eukprot:12650342-Heterocapsa_arctica.AAC.1